MLKKVAGLIFSIASFTPLISNAQTGHPYYSMAPNTQIVFQEYSIQGYWDEATMQLAVTSRAPIKIVTIKYSTTTCPNYFGNGTLFVASYFSGTTFGGSLQDGGTVSSNGISYIGEAINEHGWVHIPFIAKLATNPVAGQTIDATSNITFDCNNTTHKQYLRWRYRTIAHVNNWGSFQDTWRTGLHEYGSESGGVDRVYNYVFSRNKGMVNFWFGDLGSDGNIYNGLEYYALITPP